MIQNNEDRAAMINIYIDKSEKSLKIATVAFDMEEYNSAANRAYYSLFQSEKALLLTKGIEGDSHKHVHNSISKEFIKIGQISKDMNRKIEGMQVLRHIGDYSAEYVTREDAKKAIDEAQNFMNIAKEIISKHIEQEQIKEQREPETNGKSTDKADRLTAISSAKEVMGDRIFVTNAMNGEYSGEIIAKTDVYAIQRITDNQAVLHELTDLPGGIDIEIGEKITLHRNEGKTVLSVQDNSIEEGQER